MELRHVEGIRMAATSTDPAAIAAPRSFGPLAVAGFASLGAGAVHAAAAAAHGGSGQAALAFQVLALAQIAWGAWATIGERRLGVVAGAALSAGAVVGWAVAQTVGIGFVDGLEEPHGVGWADGIAALLALVAVVVTARRLLLEDAERGSSADGGMLFRLSAAVVVSVLALGAVAQTSTEAEGHSHGDEQATGHDDSQVGGGHEHGPSAVVPPVAYDPGPTGTTAPSAGSTTTGTATGVTEPGTQRKRVDLSGVAGVSAEQQARAEQLVETTLDDLPQFADPADAEAVGFRSIGDGFTGHEHLINWSYLDDGRTLDPNYPESLVYDTRGPTRKLVSAMFMLEPGKTLDDVPDIGGPLTQWHVHDDLCFTDDPTAPRVAGVTSVGGTCAPPLKKLPPVPMIHVWIVAHPCGPFAALEGVAAGQIKPGEERLCDTAHASAHGT